MIRINLNRSRVTNGVSDEAVVVNEVASDGMGSGNAREVIVKLLVIFLGVVALMLYERQNLDTLNAELGDVNGQLQQLQAQVGQKQGELALLKDIEPQALALTEKLKVLREFSKLRLEELQSLDYLQSVIPERVWLKNIDFSNKHFRIVGYAVETVDLTDFVNHLEGSAYFQDVIVIQDKEKPMQHGKIRDFELTARGGLKN